MKRASAILLFGLALAVPVLTVARRAAIPAPPSQTQAPSAQNNELTNARIVEMSKMGLDDDIIIARIKHGVCHFQLADTDLVNLKTAGVSSKVVAAMLESVPPAAATEPATPPSDGKVRVLVTDSQSWESRGLNQRCPELTVTNNLAKADFVLTLDHEGGKGLLAHRNKIAVFNRDGDDIYSNSTRELGNAVKDACKAMLNSHK